MLQCHVFIATSYFVGGIAHNVHCGTCSYTCHIFMDYVADQNQCAMLHNLDCLREEDEKRAQRHSDGRWGRIWMVQDGSGEKWGDKREKKINWIGEKKSQFLSCGWVWKIRKVS